MSIGSTILSLIDELNQVVAHIDTAEQADRLWSLVLKLETALVSDAGHSTSERDLLAKIKAGASFVVEAGREGGEPPTDLVQVPLAALQARVRQRMVK